MFGLSIPDQNVGLGLPVLDSHLRQGFGQLVCCGCLVFDLEEGWI